MKIRFKKENLVKSISLFQRVAANKTSSNMPGAIYMTTKQNTVEMQANDFEIGIKTEVEAEIIEPGTLVVGSKYFQELLRRLPGEFILLTKPEGSNQLHIQSDSSDFNLVTMSLDDFSLVELINDDNSLTIDGEEFKKLIDLTAYATSSDNDRPIFCGTLLEVKGNKLTMVGTDTHRMAVKTIELAESLSEPMRIVIPKRTVDEISRSLPTDQPIMVKLVWNRTQVAIMFDNVYIISRLIEGSYPDYERVIPSQFDASAVLDKKQFAGSLDRVYFMARDISFSAIRYDWDQNNVTLSTQNAEIGMAKEVVPCEFKGEPFTINFNGKYVDELLKHSSSEKIHLFLKKNGPVVIRQDNNENYIYVVTPVHTHA